jgi:hypothetical protein
VDEHDHFQENLPEHLIRVCTCGLDVPSAVLIAIVGLDRLSIQAKEWSKLPSQQHPMLFVRQTCGVDS